MSYSPGFTKPHEGTANFPHLVALPRLHNRPPIRRRHHYQLDRALLLVGAIAGETEGIAIFLDHTTKGTIRLKTGEGHLGWTLRQVKGREAILRRSLKPQFSPFQIRNEMKNCQRIPKASRAMPSKKRKAN